MSMVLLTPEFACGFKTPRTEQVTLKGAATLSIMIETRCRVCLCHRDRSIHIEREGMVGEPEKLRDKLKK
jgi:hypothetical protein